MHERVCRLDGHEKLCDGVDLQQVSARAVPIGRTRERRLQILQVGDEIDRRTLLRRLVEILYDRNDQDFHRGTFRVRGDVIEVFPASEDSRAFRIELFGDEVERLSLIDPLRGTRLAELEQLTIYPASHYVTPKERMEQALRAIEVELQDTLGDLHRDGLLLEAQRLEERTGFDLELIRETGRCKGIENYSRHLSGRDPGEPPPNLLDLDTPLTAPPPQQYAPTLSADWSALGTSAPGACGEVAKSAVRNVPAV